MQNIVNPQNIKELRDGLIQVYGKLIEKKIPVKDAKEIFNGAGKIVSTFKAELDYAAQAKEIARIEFLEYDGNRKVNKLEDFEDWKKGHKK